MPDLIGASIGGSVAGRGDMEETYSIRWTQAIGQLEANTWGDLKEAVEYGATALAILLMLDKTPFDWFKREDQFQGADFEMSQHERKSNVAKLEISGILTETLENTVQIRVKMKERKITKRGNLAQPVYVVVVEFSAPKAKIIVL